MWSVHLVVIPDIGDDVVDVSLFGLLQNPLHQLLRHPLPDGHQHEEEGDDQDGDDQNEDDDDDQDEDDYGDFEGENADLLCLLRVPMNRR